MAAAKRLCFAWKAPWWVLILDETSGDHADRQAELAHAALAAGYPVEMTSAEARERAESGAFEPRSLRWLALREAGRYAGWIEIRGAEMPWGRAAGEITGAKPIPRADECLVPATSVDEACDFGDASGYRRTVAVEALLAAHRERFAGAHVVTPRVAPPSPKEPERDRPVLTPEPGRKVPDALRDDD